MAALTLAPAVLAPSRVSFSRVALKASVVSTKSASSRRSLRIVAMSTPDLQSELQAKITEAQETCADPNATVECAVAWDEVEEISAAASDKARAAKEAASADPLEKYCDENPDADECRVYSD